MATKGQPVLLLSLETGSSSTKEIVLTELNREVVILDLGGRERKGKG